MTEIAKNYFFNLIIISKTGKVLEVATAFIKIVKIRVNASRNNSNDNIIDVIRIKVKTAIQIIIRKIGSILTSPTTPRS
jgi:hypothetical protein